MIILNVENKSTKSVKIKILSISRNNLLVLPLLNIFLKMNFGEIYIASYSLF